MKRLIASLVGASLLASAPFALAADTPRASAPMEEAHAMGGGSVALWLGLVALGIAIFLAVDDGSSPDSP